MDNKTIYALSTVFGKSGVAVLRICGPRAFDFLSKMTDIDVQVLEFRRFYYSKVFDFDSRETLDNCLIAAFKGPHSFSGEDTVEINCHGSKAVIRGLLNALSNLEDFRIAEPGEFSRRAFYNGKMDLTAAEGLADLIDAETEIQQKTALRQMNGTLFSLYEEWRNRLVSALSHVEAYIDFPEEDIPEDTVFKLENDVFKIIEAIESHLKGNNIEERLRDGFQVVISGPTNAGKSS
ncbi:MAG: tRNA uridine-5-carboxymethylaminomethyl(34) synthesis GTPase MnmE, partial [Alphaproteobacteria bacterium]|nr:tRNA uridine-5-carboxymethylaminomethyl(34) synthesis GTPase MnmE [Alphaproteobacteria bacterium]